MPHTKTFPIFVRPLPWVKPQSLVVRDGGSGTPDLRASRVFGGKDIPQEDLLDWPPSPVALFWRWLGPRRPANGNV